MASVNYPNNRRPDPVHWNLLEFLMLWVSGGGPVWFTQGAHFTPTPWRQA